MHACMHTRFPAATAHAHTIMIASSVPLFHSLFLFFQSDQGVQGALLFLKEHAADYLDRINLVVFPCVSPWGYERIQRWNYDAVDPNRRFSSGEFVPGRSFNPEAATEESTALRAYLRQKAGDEGNGSTTTTTSSKPHWLCHLDLHETTDTDETEFQPAKAARDGKPAPKKEGIPDGFYLVTEGRNQQDHQQLQQPLDASDWYAAMIAAVEKVTHIAPPDERNTIIGEPVVQKGVIALPAPANVLGLCAGVTDAPYTATTEVYPDSPSATAEICNQAQVACIRGALDFLLNQRQEKRSRLEMNGSGYIKLYGTTMSRLNTLFGCAAT
jgi:hypothetical protein